LAAITVKYPEQTHKREIVETGGDIMPYGKGTYRKPGRPKKSAVKKARAKRRMKQARMMSNRIK